MPKGTRVHRCVEHVKRKGGGVNPYAVCQSATGQSYATGRSMKKAKYNSKLMFPKGDLGVADDVEMARLFPRRIKNAGKELVSSRALPFTREKMEAHSPDVKFPKDEVV